MEIAVAMPVPSTEKPYTNYAVSEADGKIWVEFADQIKPPNPSALITTCRCRLREQRSGQMIEREKSAGANANSLKGFEVIDNIKTQVENVCSGVVSCADILAVATRDSVVQLGGPSWTVMLGRRDSRTASLNDANNNLPGPFSSLTSLISAFQAQGLSAEDMVALSGAHTIGQASCQFFRSRIYNESNIDKEFAASLQENCPFNSGPGDFNLAPLDSLTANGFDNTYYKNLRSDPLRSGIN
ncbi:hypothetical protein SUGI_0236580 [Cryptomeria japonica]|nr:hypothetical protein SUGI_0236580 [Cryptomeria japonica]